MARPFVAAIIILIRDDVYLGYVTTKYSQLSHPKPETRNLKPETQAFRCDKGVASSCALRTADLVRDGGCRGRP